MRQHRLAHLSCRELRAVAAIGPHEPLSTVARTSPLTSSSQLPPSCRAPVAATAITAAASWEATASLSEQHALQMVQRRYVHASRNITADHSPKRHQGKPQAGTNGQRSRKGRKAKDTHRLNSRHHPSAQQKQPSEQKDRQMAPLSPERATSQPAEALTKSKPLPSASLSPSPTTSVADGDAKLQKILRVHDTFRRNYRALQSSERVYLSLCRMSLGALESSRLLQRLARVVVAAQASQAANDSPRDVTRTAPTEEFAHLRVCMAAPPSEAPGENAGEPAFTVRLPLTFVRWLNHPITLPEVPPHLLFSTNGNAKEWEPSAANKSRQAEGAALWSRHCETQLGLSRAFVDVLEEALGAVVAEYRSTQQRGAVKVQSTPDEAEAILETNPDVSAHVVALISTLSQFKWVKDDLAVRGQHRRSRDGSDCPDAVEDKEADDDFTRHLQRLRASQQELQRLSAPLQQSATDPSSGATTQDALVQLKQRLRPTQEALKESLALLKLIPKLDRVCTRTDAAVAHLSPSAQNSHAHETTYTTHVLDLFLAVLLRYTLLSWPHLASSTHSASLFEALVQPWFRADIAGDAATWFTFFESCRPSVTLLTAQPASRASSSEKGDASTHEEVPIPQLFVNGATACGDYTHFIKQIRLLCWPTVLDRRSAIVQRTFALVELSETTSHGVEREGQGKDRPQELPELKEVATILYSSEKKQRLAYELMLLYLFKLDASLADAEKKHGKGSFAQQFLSTAPFRTASALSVFLVDADRFMTDRFFDTHHRKGRWLLLPTSPTRAKALGTDAVKLQEALANHCEEPYVLTRLSFCMLTALLQPHWTGLPARRTTLLYDAFTSALAGPCERVFAVQDEPSASPAAAAKEGVSVWEGVLHPLLCSAGGKQFQQFTWRQLLRELKEMSRDATPSSATVSKASNASEAADGGEQQDTHAKTVQRRLRDLVRLGYLAAYLLTAQAHLRMEGFPSEHNHSDKDGRELFDATFVEAISSRFRTAFLTVLNTSSQESESAEQITAVQHYLALHWPTSLPVSTTAQAALAARAPTMVLCQRYLETVIFTPRLQAESTAWLARRMLVHRRQADIQGVRDATLLHWFGLLQEEELGMHALPLTLDVLYDGLWAVLSRRYSAHRVEGDTATSGDSGDCDNDTWLEQWVSPAPLSSPSSDVLLTAEELSVALRVMGAVLGRGGLASLSGLDRTVSPAPSSPHAVPPPGVSAPDTAPSARGDAHSEKPATEASASTAASPLNVQLPAPALFANMASVVLKRAAMDASAPTTAKAPGSQADTTQSTTAAAGTAEAPVTGTTEKNTAVRMKQRLQALRRFLEASVLHALPNMSVPSRVEAVYVGLVSIEEVAARTTLLNDETARKAEDVVKELRSSRRHALYVCELVLLKYVGSIQEGTSMSKGAGNTLSAFLARLLETVVQVEVQLAMEELKDSTSLEGSTPTASDGANTQNIADTQAKKGFAKVSESVTMADHARRVVRAHAVAAYVFMSCTPEATASPVLSFSSLLGVLLYRLDDCVLTATSRGNGEELLLWLSTAALLYQQQAQVQATLSKEGDGLNDDDGVLSPAWVSRSLTRSVKEEPEPASDAPSRRALLELVSSPQPTTPSAVDMALLRQWFCYVFGRLAPLVVSNLSPAGGGSSPSFRHTAYAALAMRALQETGVPAPSSLLSVTDQFMQRAAQDRRLVQRQSRLLVAALAAQSPAFSAQMTSHGVLPLVSFFRDAKDSLTLAEVGEGLDLVRALAAATTLPCKPSLAVSAAFLTTSFVSTASRGGARPQYRSQEATPSRSDPLPRSTEETAHSQTKNHPTETMDAVASETSVGAPGSAGDQSAAATATLSLPSTITQPMYPIVRPPPALVRSAWGALAHRVLITAEEALTSDVAESHSVPVDTVLSLLIAAVDAGAAVEAADTQVFARLVSMVVLVTTMHAQARLSLVQWHALVRACGTSEGAERRDMASFLKEPLQEALAALKTASLASSSSAAADMWRFTDVCATPVVKRDTNHRQSALGTQPSARETAQGLGLLLEALPTLFVESETFWEDIGEVVEACSEAMVEANKLASPRCREEAGFWMEEWIQSYNWAVLSAGHPSMQIQATHDHDEEAEEIAAPEA